MKSYNLVISPLARNDIIGIYQFGKRNWGVAKSSIYIDMLKAQIWNLKKHPKIGMEREELFPYLRSFTVESHVVFYRLDPKNIEIVRVLHGRQDPQRQIK